MSMSTEVEIPKGINFGSWGGEGEKTVIKFYEFWSSYLAPTKNIFGMFHWVLGLLAKGLYGITSALEEVFYAMFGLFGMLNDLTQNTLLYKFYHYFQMIGISLFCLLLVYQISVGLFSSKPMKYKKMIQSFTVVLVVLSVLPTAVTKFGSEAEKAVQGTRTLQVSGSSSAKISTIALSPIKDNTVDLIVLNNNYWGTKVDGNHQSTVQFELNKGGTIKKVLNRDGTEKKDFNLNTITEGTVNRVNFGETLGLDNLALTENLKPNKDVAKGLFLNFIKGDGEDVVVDSVSEKISIKSMEQGYMRYKVNWFSVFAEYIALILILISLSFKTVKSFFEILISVIIAPIVGYSSTKSTKKFKELLTSILGGITSIMLEVVILRVLLYFMNVAPQLDLVQQIENPFGKGLAIALMYIGSFYGAFTGISLIERFTGVSQGHSTGLQQLMGTLTAGMAAGGLMKTGTHLAAGAGAGAVGLVSKAPGVAAKGIRTGFKASDTAKGIAQGLQTAYKAEGVKGMFGAVSENIQQGVQGIGDKFQEKSVEAQNKGIETTENARQMTAGAFTTDQTKDREKAIADFSHSAGLQTQAEKNPVNPLRELPKSTQKPSQTGGLNRPPLTPTPSASGATSNVDYTTLGSGNHEVSQGIPVDLNSEPVMETGSGLSFSPVQSEESGGISSVAPSMNEPQISQTMESSSSGVSSSPQVQTTSSVNSGLSFSPVQSEESGGISSVAPSMNEPQSSQSVDSSSGGISSPTQTQTTTSTNGGVSSVVPSMNEPQFSQSVDSSSSDISSSPQTQTTTSTGGGITQKPPTTTPRPSLSQKAFQTSQSQFQKGKASGVKHQQQMKSSFDKIFNASQRGNITGHMGEDE